MRAESSTLVDDAFAEEPFVQKNFFAPFSLSDAMTVSTFEFSLLVGPISRTASPKALVVRCNNFSDISSHGNNVNHVGSNTHMVREHPNESNS